MHELDASYGGQKIRQLWVDVLDDDTKNAETSHIGRVGLYVRFTPIKPQSHLINCFIPVVVVVMKV